MKKSAIKKYAPQARKDFIAAVTRRAEVLGLNPKSPGEVKRDGQVLLINGQAFPAAIESKRNAMQKRIAEQGFAIVMDAMAYTWFNRLVAIRYMELHGFLDHGYRVLSHPANIEAGHTQPEILDHIAELNLPGLDRSRALDLKLAGNRDEVLYREVLLAQCHRLHTAMPFLFESLDDATELLLPDGLLRTDSIVGQLVTTIGEVDWQDVEIIGWLYQFYISEKKDQVIGKVVKSEDIPAATQLFTPNWIVKYLVQNSLGRLWLMANPTSALAAKWEYYIQPAEQTPEVNAQLDALIQARIAEDGGSTLNPESLTLLDPACGSGHILVEAYDLLRDIYLERGYRRQDIPRLILEKNLYGLDIDDRAAQLAGFALLMKARADDRRLFGQPVALNVLALQEATEGSAAELHGAMNVPQIDYAVVSQLAATFEQAKTFGSLIQIPAEMTKDLPELRWELEAARDGGDMLGRDAAATLLRLVAQAEVLAKRFDATVANPPYMGAKGMNPLLKGWAKSQYPDSKADLFAMFMSRAHDSCRASGISSMVVMQSWMYLSTYEAVRQRVIEDASVLSLVHVGYNSFPELNSKIAQGVCFSILKCCIPKLQASFIDLNSAPKSADKNEVFRNRTDKSLFIRSPDEFKAIPGSPFAYRASDNVFSAFRKCGPLGAECKPRTGLNTGNNDLYLKQWHELAIDSICFSAESSDEASQSGKKWFPYNKGGPFRKWWGNNELVVNWLDDGREIKEFATERNNGSHWSRFIQNTAFFFKPGLTWSFINYNFGVRVKRSGFLFDVQGTSAFPEEEDTLWFAAYLNSAVCQFFLELLNPTLSYQAGNVSSLPLKEPIKGSVQDHAERLVGISEMDWNSFETAWGFSANALVKRDAKSIDAAFCEQSNEWSRLTSEFIALEHEINVFFVDLFGLEKEVATHVNSKLATIDRNPKFRFPSLENPKEIDGRVRSEAAGELVSYSMGCMMGRYSLDAPGLIYAHAGNEGFNPSCYETFPADDDGIVPITDEAWFDDDGANRIREFVRVVWGEETEAENMAWLAESLGSKASESADDTIRRYLSRDFYKDHLQTYKKRPIYWLFSSGKHKAFEALVYLHRYNAGTLSRMRMEYVVPLQSRMQSRIDSLEQDIHAATSSAETKRLQKQRDKLTKQLDELRRYDETLRHHADQRITLDLDDGVKVNYGKFGDLLAEVKAVTGKAPSA